MPVVASRRRRSHCRLSKRSVRGRTRRQVQSRRGKREGVNKGRRSVVSRRRRLGGMEQVTNTPPNNTSYNKSLRRQVRKAFAKGTGWHHALSKKKNQEIDNIKQELPEEPVHEKPEEPAREKPEDKQLLWRFKAKKLGGFMGTTPQQRYFQCLPNASKAYIIVYYYDDPNYTKESHKGTMFVYDYQDASSTQYPLSVYFYARKMNKPKPGVATGTFSDIKTYTLIFDSEEEHRQVIDFFDEHKRVWMTNDLGKEGLAKKYEDQLQQLAPRYEKFGTVVAYESTTPLEMDMPERRKNIISKINQLLNIDIKRMREQGTYETDPVLQEFVRSVINVPSLNEHSDWHDIQSALEALDKFSNIYLAKTKIRECERLAAIDEDPPEPQYF